MTGDPRSENLRERVESLARKRRLREAAPMIEQLLSSVPGVTWLGFANEEDGPAAPESFWEIVYRRSADGRIADDTPSEEERRWRLDWLAKAGLSRECWVALVGDFWGLPWACLKVSSAGEWQAALLDAVGDAEIAFLSGDRRRLLAFESSWDDYNVHLMHLQGGDRDASGR